MVLKLLLKPFLTLPAADKTPRERGVALLTAILIIALMLLFTADMIINSTVSLRLAVAERDNIKAEYMAKSGFNLGLFLIQSDWAADLAGFLVGETMPSDSADDIWAIMNGMPIGGATSDLLDSTMEGFNLSKVNDGSVIDQLKLFDGQFVIETTDEGGRVNVNKCGGQAYECEKLLTTLFSCPAEKAFLEKRKVRPEQLFANVKDWWDERNDPTPGGGTDENEPYEGREPKVRPKNAPYDSLEELKQVAAWDDDIYKVFSPYLTVFPMQDEIKDKPYVNINTASRELIGCLVPPSMGPNAIRALSFTAPSADGPPKNSVKGISDLKEIVEQTLGGNADQTKFFTYFSDTFRVTAKGEVGDQLRTLEVLVQRRFPTEEERKLKVQTSYKILHTKML